MSMDEKQRLIWDKTFMAFGSMMKAVDSSKLDEDHFWLYAEEAWKWSVKQVAELVDQLYNGTLPKADTPADEQNGTDKTLEPLPPPPPPKPDPTPSGETTVVKVKGFAVNRQGTRNGHDWTQYKLTDMFDRNYFTFRSGYELGKEYEIDFMWGEKDGKKWRTINDKTSPRPVNPKMYMDIPEPEEQVDDTIPF